MKYTRLMIMLSTILITSVSTAQNGLYIGLEGGTTNQDGLPSQAATGATSVDDGLSINSIRFSLGYNHDFTSKFGIGFEIGGGSFGKTTYHYANGSKTEVSTSTLEFLATSMWHVNDKFDVIGKVGGNRSTAEVTGANAPPEDTFIQPQAGIGIAYNMTQRLSATATYMHVFGSSISTIAGLSDAVPTLNEFLLGLRFNFGS